MEEFRARGRNNIAAARGEKVDKTKAHVFLAGREATEKENRVGMIAVQVPTLLCMQNKFIMHSRYCFIEQYVHPRESNIYMANLICSYGMNNNYN